jgi:hypothetical protein
MNVCYKISMRLLIILSVLVLASCSKKEAEPVAAEPTEIQAPADSKGASEAPAEAAAEAEGASEEYVMPWDDWGEQGLTLLEAGQAPLRTLRRSFEQGNKANVALAIKATGGETQKVDATFRLALETTEVDKDGSRATVAVRVDEASFGAEAINAVRDLRGQYALDSLGQITDIEFESPKDPDSLSVGAITLLKRHLFILSVPLPKQDVGVGARWSVLETIPEGSMPVVQRTIYEITKIEGDTIHVRTIVDQASKAPNFKGAIKSLGLSGRGTGAASFDPHQLAPASAGRDTSRDLRFYKIDSQQVVDVVLGFETQMSTL